MLIILALPMTLYIVSIIILTTLSMNSHGFV